MRLDQAGAELSDSLIAEKNRYRAIRQTLPSTLVMTDSMPSVLFLASSAGNKNVRLPAATALQVGLWYRFFNTGSTGTLVVVDSAGAALSPAVALAPGISAEVMWDGTVWRPHRASTSSSS